MEKRHIPKPKGGQDIDSGIAGMIYMEEQGKKERKLSSFFTRPAYAGTSLEQKEFKSGCKCEPCPYYREPGEGRKKDCQFPWLNPEEYDLAAYDYLPCKEVKHAED